MSYHSSLQCPLCWAGPATLPTWILSFLSIGPWKQETQNVQLRAVEYNEMGLSLYPWQKCPLWRKRTSHPSEPRSVGMKAHPSRTFLLYWNANLSALAAGGLFYPATKMWLHSIHDLPPSGCFYLRFLHFRLPFYILQFFNTFPLSFIILTEPWATWVGTVWVHLYADFFFNVNTI